MSVGNNNFVVVWNSQPEGNYGDRFVLGRTSQSEEFPIGDFSWSSLGAVAADASGAFVAAWREDALSTPIRARRFNPAGAPTGPQLSVAQGQFFALVGEPVVASDPGGNFVVVWADRYDSGLGFRLMGRRYEAAGVPLGDAFVVSTQTDYYYDPKVWKPSVAMDRRGDFVVAWQERADFGWDVVARTFDASGPTDPPFFVHREPGYQGAASVAVNRTGDFVVAWQFQGSDSDLTTDVGARRFRRDLIFRNGF
jgi:hypothetical protein